MKKNNNLIALACLPPFEAFFACWWIWGVLTSKDKAAFQRLSSFAMFAIAEMVLLRILWLVFPHSQLIKCLNVGTWLLGAIPGAWWTLLSSPYHMHINLF
ncbi:hypothetical protein [Burkholderia cenocepacia]|uniref:hypothetical protein n=1 Tax=Burkholderia cenocepacia TaxID=95486 RepID=UPI00192A9664|nr:hypothetical protein [Burkholderia cenocepacia]